MQSMIRLSFVVQTTEMVKSTNRQFSLPYLVHVPNLTQDKEEQYHKYILESKENRSVNDITSALQKQLQQQCTW